MEEHVILRRRSPRMLLACIFVTSMMFASSSVSTTFSTDPSTERSGPPLSAALSAGIDRFGSANGNELIRIAVVKPVFTATAYSNAFYVFYVFGGSKTNQTYIFTDLQYLNVSVKDSWGYSNGLSIFLSSEEAKKNGLVLDKTFRIIDEINITLGGLFRNGNRLYDVVILGFTEYVTKEEYNAYWEFVASGGTLIIMDACNFLAEVKYYPSADAGKPGYVSLVKGHGWEFNGTCAWRSVYHRWMNEDTNWVGSEYWHFWYGTHYDRFTVNTSHPISAYLRDKFSESITSSYGAHEENLLQNFTNTEIIGYWHLINPAEYPGHPIAAYQHRYGNGSVFHSGIMASDVIAQDPCMQIFLLAAVKLSLTGKVDGELIQGGNNGGGANSTYSAALVIVPTALGISVAMFGTLLARDRRIKRRLEKQHHTGRRRRKAT